MDILSRISRALLPSVAPDTTASEEWGEAREASEAVRLPQRQPINLVRAKHAQRRAVGGWWKDEWGGWHQTEE